MVDDDGFSVEVDGEELFTLQEDRNAPNGERIPRGSENYDSLTAMIDFGIRLGVAGGQHLANFDTVKLVMKPGIRRGLQSGVYRFAQRDGSVAANIIQKGGPNKGQTVANLRFQPADTAKLANVAAGAWQVAAIVTAQHYLHEINSKLEDLNEGIRGIREFLENDQYATVIAERDRLRRDCEVFLSDVFSQQREDRLAERIEEVFTKAHGNAIQRMLNLRGLDYRTDIKGAKRSWAQAEKEASAFLFHLTVINEVIVLQRTIIGKSKRLEMYSQDLESLLEGFGEVLFSMSEHYVQQSKKNSKPKISPPPASIITGGAPPIVKIGAAVVYGAAYLIQRGRHETWKIMSEQSSGGYWSVKKQLNQVNQAVRRLTSTRHPDELTVYATLDASGQVKDLRLPGLTPQR